VRQARSEIREIRIPGYVTANVVPVTLCDSQESGVVECLGVPGIRLQVLPPKRRGPLAPDRISPLST
jgi:hypothetical protein